MDLTTYDRLIRHLQHAEGVRLGPQSVDDLPSGSGVEATLTFDLDTRRLQTDLDAVNRVLSRYGLRAGVAEPSFRTGCTLARAKTVVEGARAGAGGVQAI